MIENSATFNTPTSTEIFEQEYFQIKDTVVQSVLQKVIANKVEDYDSGQLDQSVIDACIEDVFFLGKLKKINDIVTGGREDITQAIEEYTKTIEEELLQPDSGIDRKKKKTLIKKQTQIIANYMSKFTGKRFVEEMNREYNERLQIPTNAHFMTVMTRRVSDKIMSFDKNKTPDIKKLNSVATLFFDLDGLKMLNDMSIGAYTSGDKALRVMANALTDHELEKWAKNFNIELVPAHRSGDEFLLGIVAKDDIDLSSSEDNFTGVDGENVTGVSIAKYIGEYVKNKVKNFGQADSKEYTNNKLLKTEGQNKKILQEKKNQITVPRSMEEIIDFSSKEQREKFEREIKKMPESLQNLFNNNFVYQLSCSYGYATLNDAFKRNIQDKKDFSADDITYEGIVYALTGRGLVDSAVDKMKVDKKYSRIQRANSQDPREQLLEILYRTGREHRGWHIDKEDFAEIHKVLIEFKEEALELKKQLKRERREKAIEKRRKKGRENVIEHNAKMTARKEKELKDEIARLKEELKNGQSKLKKVVEWARKSISNFFS